MLSVAEFGLTSIKFTIAQYKNNQILTLPQYYYVSILYIVYYLFFK